jgi:hypothetical protein
VTIITVTPFGEILTPVKVTKFTIDRGRGADFSSRFEAGKAVSGVPYGEFLAQVRAGDRVIAGFVHVNRENALLVLAGPKVIIERGQSAGPGVVGRLVGASGTKPTWVRMLRVFSEDECCTTVPVSDDGKFSFGAMEEGDYLFLALTDGRVVCEGRVIVRAVNLTIEADTTTGQLAVTPR